MKQRYLKPNFFTMVTPIIVLFASMSLATTIVVDQQQPVIDLSVGGLAIGGQSNQKLAQTITVGINGSLSQVDLPIVCESGKLIIEIQGVGQDGKPDGNILMKKRYHGKRLPTEQSQELRAFKFRKRKDFVQGDRFAIVMRNEGGSCGIFDGPLGNPYVAGEVFFDDAVNPSGWIPKSQFDDRDLPFQTWMVIP